jgi:hypothetical protein
MNVCVNQQHQYVAALPIALINRTRAYHVCRDVPGAPAGVHRRDTPLAASLKQRPKGIVRRLFGGQEGTDVLDAPSTYRLPPALVWLRHQAASPSSFPATPTDKGLCYPPAGSESRRHIEGSAHYSARRLKSRGRHWLKSTLISVAWLRSASLKFARSAKARRPALYYLALFTLQPLRFDDVCIA